MSLGEARDGLGEGGPRGRHPFPGLQLGAEVREGDEGPGLQPASVAGGEIGLRVRVRDGGVDLLIEDQEGT